MKIYVTRNGEQFGLYAREDVQALIDSGNFTPSDYAWTAGLDDWKPISQLRLGERLDELPARNPYVFFPRTLTRKQYINRWLLLLAVVVAGLLFFVAAPKGIPAEVAGIVFPIVALLGAIYNIFGLSIPRLRNAAAFCGTRRPAVDVSRLRDCA